MGTAMHMAAPYLVVLQISELLFILRGFVFVIMLCVYFHNFHFQKNIFFTSLRCQFECQRSRAAFAWPPALPFWPPIFEKLWRARSPLYRSRFLRPRYHFSAFFEIYKIYIPSHRSKLKTVAKNRNKICWFFRKKSAKFHPKFCNKNWVSTGAKECTFCRSRKMLQNDTLVAKIGFDTDENEPAKVSRK